MKAVAIVLSTILVLAFVGSVIFIGVKTYGYMTDEGMSFSEGIGSGWNDYTKLFDIFKTKAETDPNYIGTDKANSIQYHGLTTVE